MTGTVRHTDRTTTIQECNVQQETGSNVKGQTFLKTTTEFFKKRVDAAKLFVYGVAWAKHAKLIDQNSVRGGNLSFTANVIKLGAGGFFELPEKLAEIGEASNNWVKDRTTDKAKEVFWAVNNAVSPAKDAVELAKISGIVDVPAPHFNLLQKVGGVSMLLGFGKMTYDSVEKFAAEDARRPGNDPLKIVKHDVALRKHMIDFAKAVSYFVLGLLICSSLFLGVVAAPIAFTIAGTSALVFSILGFYNEELGKISLTSRSVTWNWT